MNAPFLRADMFRVTHPDYRDFYATVAMSRRYPTRFTTAVVGAVYLADQPQTAVDELRRRARLNRVPLASFAPRSMFVVDVQLQTILDLGDPGVREAWGVTELDVAGDDYTRCQEIAAAAAAAGFEGIRWPSATGSGVSLAVFFERLARGSGLRIRAEYDLDLAALDRGEPVLELISALRRW